MTCRFVPIPNPPANETLSNETRQTVTAAFDALSNWRDETAAANDRCLTKVLDQMSDAARAMGWPDHVISATREHLLNASKMQTQMIDQVMDSWKQQLKSPTAPMAVPRFINQISGLSWSPFPSSMTEMMPIGGMPLAPWKFWLQAAEMWQRQWMSTMSAWTEPRSSRSQEAPRKRAA